MIPVPTALTLDATGTLIHCPRRGEIYAEVLRRHGLEAAPEAVESGLARVFEEQECLSAYGRDRYAAHPDGPEGYWRGVLQRLAEHLGLAAPSPFAAAELYDRFAKADAWEVYPEIPGVLRRLAAAGIPMAVIGNWDLRLSGLLEALDLAPFFQAVLVSAELGVEKPHPVIFRAALRALATGPAQVLHVGDDRRKDLEGAQGLGLEARWLVRPPKTVRGFAQAETVASLAEVLPLLGLPEDMGTKSPKPVR